MTDCATAQESVARVATRVLLAWKNGQCADLQKQMEHSRRSLLEPCSRDACEQERLEALEGALEGLSSLPHARVQAALRLLEHLANHETHQLRPKFLN
jgi:hypothetical protein